MHVPNIKEISFSNSFTIFYNLFISLCVGLASVEKLILFKAVNIFSSITLFVMVLLQDCIGNDGNNRTIQMVFCFF